MASHGNLAVSIAFWVSARMDEEREKERDRERCCLKQRWGHTGSIPKHKMVQGYYMLLSQTLPPCLSKRRPRHARRGWSHSETEGRDTQMLTMGALDIACDQRLLTRAVQWICATEPKL